MKVIVFCHRLEVGGIQTNAIDLTALLRDRHGIDPVLFAIPGPMVEVAKSKGLKYTPVDDADRRPSSRIGQRLRELVRDESPDIVHAWAWAQILETFFGTHLLDRTPMLATSMTMRFVRFLPRSVPTTFGFDMLAHEAEPKWSAPMYLLEPPVNVATDRPGIVDGDRFVADYALDPRATRIVTVSRLSRHLKLESVERAIRAVDQLAEAHNVQLIIVGGGDSGARVSSSARAVNDRHNRRVVVPIGELLDPRSAYESADVMMAMGGSALRSMAFAKPVVVVGEQGFSEILTPESLPTFLWQGWYGLGAGIPTPDPLVDQFAALISAPDRRAALGAFGRNIAVDRFGLEPVAANLARYLRESAAYKAPRPTTLLDAARVGTLRGMRTAQETIDPRLERQPLRRSRPPS